MSRAELIRRYTIFAFALFFTSLGVSIVTRSCLGTSPISSVPFVMSLNTPLSMGAYIMLLNMSLILAQMAMLGWQECKRRRMELLLQLPVAVVFGLFIDITMWMTSLYEINLYFLQMVSLVVGCGVLAFGVALEVAADVTMISAEYTTQIASQKLNIEFGMVKLGLDVSFVIFATAISLLFAGVVEGVREGTVIAALITGPFVRIIIPRLNWLREWASSADDKRREKAALSSNIVITITREYGSGGHLVGAMIAERLGLPFYDNELIAMVAKESRFSEEEITTQEQNMPNNILYQMIMLDYGAPLEKSLSSADALFVAQSKVIRRLASKGACVIVGRCSDYILNDMPRSINLFIHASEEYKVQHAISEYGLNPDTAPEEVERVNRARKTHYQHYANREWGDSRNYHLTCDTSKVSPDKICEIVEELYLSQA